MQIKQRLSRIGLPALFAGFFVLAGGTAYAWTTCYNFSSMSVGSSWSVGDSLSLATATVNFKQFRLGDGSWTSTGFAEIDASTNANGSPTKELELNNIMVQVVPDSDAYSATFLYADFGGNVNLGVNGDHRNVANMIALDGTVVGGCDVTVTQTISGSNRRGEVTIVPQEGEVIEKFGTGGQEFWIDDVCFDH